MTTPLVKRVTPVLAVDSVEKSLPFWEQLGFACTVQVPHEDTVGFAILLRDEQEVMLQSVESIKADLGAATAKVDGRSAALFIEVDDLAAIERLLGDYPIEMPRRTTFYGMHEIGVREPGGHFLVFAQPSSKS